MTVRQRPTWNRLLLGLTIVLPWMVVGCGGDDTNSANGAAGSGAAECTSGATESCYDGPSGTLGVGVCKSGTKTCDANGAWGVCEGQVTPTTESCTTAEDDDCNGKTNDTGEGCACTPNVSESCYSGPDGTEGVGACVAGTRKCKADGSGWGECTGEVTPKTEDCHTAEDEDCNGEMPPCAGDSPVVDLRADVNRNGTVDLDDDTEDQGEDTWDSTHGAIFLANIDDDDKSCATTGQTDDEYAACNDASNDVIDGDSDEEDLARLRTVPWPTAPDDASGTLTVSPANAKVRLFRRVGADFEVFDPAADTISAEQLRNGVEFGLEGLDVVRGGTGAWDGYVDITLKVIGGTAPSGGKFEDKTDNVKLRLAPMLFRHHLEPAETVYATYFSDADSAAFRGDLQDAVTAAGVPNGELVTFNVYDQWTQDFFETAYMSMPAPNGEQKVIHVNVRSANYDAYTPGLRTAGKVVFTKLRGPDVGGVVQYDENHDDNMDSLNSFGNFETIPPYAYNGVNYSQGRVIRGSNPSFYPDKSFDAMVTAQGQQSMVVADTEWLYVGHIDETVSFLKTDSARGWFMLVADAPLAKQMFEDLEAAGHGDVQMFEGQLTYSNQSAAISITEVLNDVDLMNDSAWAATKINGQVNEIKAETGLTDDEIVSSAFLFTKEYGYSVAYQPGMVNGIYLSDSNFGAPDPHGPIIDGADPFKQQMESVLGEHGITIRWIENWSLYHILDGEVHCGSNTKRQISNNAIWWNQAP